MYKQLKHINKRIIAIASILLVIIIAVSIRAGAVLHTTGQNVTHQTLEGAAVLDDPTQAVIEIPDPTETQSNIKFKGIPLYNQKAYPDTPYGSYGTISSHGCGIACIAMVTTYITDDYHSVLDLARRFGHYNTINGSLWSIFEETAPQLGLETPSQTYDWSLVKQAVADGRPVIALMDTGMFSTTRHFVVIASVTDDGKYIINDPNGENWFKDEEMIEGFANGFTEEQIRSNGVTYWIYGHKKDVNNQTA